MKSLKETNIAKQPSYHATTQQTWTHYGTTDTILQFQWNVTPTPKVIQFSIQRLEVHVLTPLRCHSSIGSWNGRQQLVSPHPLWSSGLLSPSLVVAIYNFKAQITCQIELRPSPVFPVHAVLVSQVSIAIQSPQRKLDHKVSSYLPVWRLSREDLRQHSR